MILALLKTYLLAFKYIIPKPLTVLLIPSNCAVHEKLKEVDHFPSPVFLTSYTIPV
jgi:hypothetical protein